MKRPLAIDLDNTLAEFSQAFIDFHNEMYGSTLKKEEFVGPDINSVFGLPFEEIMRRVGAFEAADAKKKILPSDGAQEMIFRLQQHYALHVITNRPVEVKDDTAWWLDQHFPGKFSEIHFCSRGTTIIRPKNAVCKHIGAAILLEDDLVNVHCCAADGIHVYLFDQPWNRHQLPMLAGAIVRVPSWYDQILETLFP